MGDYLKSLLEVFGMTRTRWAMVKRACGIKSKGCGCGNRQQQVNRWGDTIRNLIIPPKT